MLPTERPGVAWAATRHQVVAEALDRATATLLAEFAGRLPAEVILDQLDYACQQLLAAGVTRGAEFGHRITGPCAVMCPLRTGTRRNQVPPRRGRRGHREKGAEAPSRQPDRSAPGRTGEERSLRCASMS